MSSNSALVVVDPPDQYANWTHVELVVTLRGMRQYVAFTYIIVNFFGFLINGWVLQMVAPLVGWVESPKVPKSILFFILTLCISDLMTMMAMVLLNLELLYGTWSFSSTLCTAYLLCDGMNKFVAPLIIFLISRTCYETVCLNDELYRRKAASLKFAYVQIMVATCFVLVILWPVFAYSKVSTFVVRANATTREVSYARKCSFSPPPNVELVFNILASVLCYALPSIGLIYSYGSVPVFLLWRRREAVARQSKIPDSIIRKVTLTVLILTAVYLTCWTPYWLGLYAQRFLRISMTKRRVLLMYLFHLLPFVSCAIYPAIFTFMNRPIKAAHADFVRAQRRRLKSFTSEASVRISEAMGMLSVSSECPPVEGEDHRRKTLEANQRRGLRRIATQKQRLQRSASNSLQDSGIAVDGLQQCRTERK